MKFLIQVACSSVCDHARNNFQRFWHLGLNRKLFLRGETTWNSKNENRFMSQEYFFIIPMSTRPPPHLGRAHSFYTLQAFTQRSFYSRQASTHGNHLHPAIFYAKRLFHSANFKHRSFYTQQVFTDRFVTQRNFPVHHDSRNCNSNWVSAPLPKQEKNWGNLSFLTENLKRKSRTQKLRKSSDKLLSHPLWGHSHTIDKFYLQETIILYRQPHQRGTWQQPLPSTRCRTGRRNRFAPETLSFKPLDTEKHKVSCSDFLPKTNPTQHSCSHYSAFCSRKRCRLAEQRGKPLRVPTKSSLPLVTTSLCGHFPLCPLPYASATISLSHHFPQSPLP